MKNKILASVGVLISLVILGGVINSPKPEVAGTKTLAPSPVATAAPFLTPSPIPTIIATPIPSSTSPITQTSDSVAQPTTTSVQNSGLSNDNYYINSQGNKVHSPAYSNSIPDGATALCRDGTYSFSQSRRGTCSHHGGVSQWL